jgi:Ca2+-binding RTX toxin-like protein
MMFPARTRLVVLSAALVVASVLVMSASASGTAAWPSCFGEPATIVGTDGNDTINGSHGDDVIAALGGDDVVISGGSNDEDLICGGDGNDTLLVSTGGEGLFALDWAVVSGDAGDDRIQGAKDTFVEADYEESPEPVVVDLGAGTESGWGNDTLVRVNFADGSNHDDTLTGSASSDGLYGGGGNDTLAGSGGGDWLGGGPSADRIDGGAGRDFLDYSWQVPAGVHVNVAKGTASGGAGADTFRSAEIVNGSKYADLLIGGAAADRLEGNGGNDKLYGGRGKDTLNGGPGKDRADGGPARDVCRAEKRIHCP